MLLATAPKNEADQLVASAIASVGEIASLPQLTIKIIKIVENAKSTARDLYEVIKSDPALSARLLKVVNSAFYGLPGQIASIDRAIVLLGLSAVKNIAVAASMTHMFKGGEEISGFSGVELWRHSIAVGVGCRALTAAQGRPSVEESFLAGLLHDLGLLVERQVFPAKLKEVIAAHEAGARDFCSLERKIIGADHQAFGMALATKWRFPPTLCMSVGYHHKPMDLAAVNRELPTLVHIADILACRSGVGLSYTAADQNWTEEMLAIIELDEAQIAAVADKLPELIALTESIFAD